MSALKGIAGVVLVGALVAAPAMVMVTHHLEEIPAGFTHALILQDGKILAKGELGATITSASVSEAFRYPLRVDYEAGRFRVIAS